MSTEKISPVIRISREELLKHELFKKLMWEDNAAIKKGYLPFIVDAAPDATKEPGRRQFHIFREEDGSYKYLVENSSGKIKEGKIEEAELKAELGLQYTEFTTALKSKNSHALLAFMPALLKIELEKGRPIDSVPDASKKPDTMKLYTDLARGFNIYGKAFRNSYKEEYKKPWTPPAGDNQVKTETQADEIIKRQLQVDDTALAQFKNAYVQEIASIPIAPLTNLGNYRSVQQIKTNHLYKTPEGMIAVRIEINVEAILAPDQGKVYPLKCKIEVDWEPNDQGELQLKSMRISGPDRDIVAKLFKEGNQDEFLEQLAKFEIPESEIIKETLFSVQKRIALEEKSNSVPDYMKDYINQFKLILRKNLSPDDLLSEIKKIPLPVLSKDEKQKNGDFFTLFKNLSEKKNPAELRIFANGINDKMDKMPGEMEISNDFLQELITEEQKGIDLQDFVEKMSTRWDGKEVLVEAAKMDVSVYQEIVDPKVTLTYLFRQIGEFLGLVDPRPEFTTQDHLAVLANHPELLDDPKKDNLYRAILQNASPEEKLLYLSSKYLSFDDKLSLLSTYMTDPTKNPLALRDEFISTLNKEIFSVLKEGKGEDRYMAVRQFLDKCLLEGDLHKVEWLRSTGLKESFIECQKGFSASPESIAYRLNLLLKGNGIEENRVRFGEEWFRTLGNDVNRLVKSGGKFVSLAHSIEIQSIINTINDHEVLYNAWKELPGLKSVLKPSFNKEVENQAKVVTDEVKEADNVARKSVDAASSRVELTKTGEPPRSDPIAITSHRPEG